MSSHSGSFAGLKLGLGCVLVGAGLLIYGRQFTSVNFQTTGGLNWNTTAFTNITSDVSESETVEYRHLEFSDRGPSRQLWPNDSFCNRLFVRPGRGLWATWLLSFPRSGNTWTRYLIEAATGVYTTSVYHDDILVRLGFDGERQDINAGTTVLRKTHDSGWIQNSSDPVILLVRDPRRSIVSFWSWMRLKSKPDGYKLSLPEIGYKTPAFNMFVLIKIREWERMITKAAENYTNMTTLYYEDLLQDPLKEIRRILDFLKVKADEERLECLSRHLEGPFRGAKKVEDPFNNLQDKILSEAIKSASALLRSNGYSPLPDYKP